MNFLGQSIIEYNTNTTTTEIDPSNITVNGELLSILLENKSKSITILNKYLGNISVNTSSINYNIIGDSIYLGSTVNEFNNNNILIYRNGVCLKKSTDVLYITSDTIRLIDELYPNETILIIK